MVGVGRLTPMRNSAKMIKQGNVAVIYQIRLIENRKLNSLKNLYTVSPILFYFLIVFCDIYLKKDEIRSEYPFIISNDSRKIYLSFILEYL